MRYSFIVLFFVYLIIYFLNIITIKIKFSNKPAAFGCKSQSAKIQELVGFL
jgi:hypothetical protein